MILDDRYGADLLPELDESGWWIARPVEQPGSRPLRFEQGRNVQAMLREWPARHVASAWWHSTRTICQSCGISRLKRYVIFPRRVKTQAANLLEVIPPILTDDPRDADDVLVNAVEALAAAGILPDWWKLPAPARAQTWKRLEAVIYDADPYCRGVLVLGLDAPIDELAGQLALAAAQPLCRGFAVGRTIFGETARAWFVNKIDDASAVEAIAQRYLRLIQRFAVARPSAPAPEAHAQAFVAG